jgi:hypothetical protein
MLLLPLIIEHTIGERLPHLQGSDRAARGMLMRHTRTAAIT